MTENLTPDELAVLDAIQNENPAELTEMQKDLQEQYQAFLIPPSDDGAVTGMSADTPAPAIRLVSIGENGISQLLEVPVSGPNDPVLRAALKKHAPQQATKSAKVRDDALVAAFAEALAVKRAKGAAAAKTPEPPAMSVSQSADRSGDYDFREATRQKLADMEAEAKLQAEYRTMEPPPRPGVGVSVSLGAAGRLDLVFRDVVIEQNTLVLVADKPAPGRPGWVPPVPHPGEEPVPLVLEIDSREGPIYVRAFSIGISYPFNGAVHYVLLVDRPAE